MQSAQVRLTREQIKALDKLVASGLFSSRNEAVREAVRRLTVEYMPVTEFRWPVFGPRTEDELRKILDSSEDAQGVKLSREMMAAVRESIRL
ncbi:MAG: ribbon-helix-helix protein, CopG family [Candidatus Bathyarchaeia archaeon]